MIGAILSMKYVGKKAWIPSIIFWLVYFIAMAIVGAVLTAIVPTWTMISIAISAAVFIALAHYWYKIALFESLKIFAVAVVLDLIIMLVIVAALVAYIGLTLPEWFPYLGFL